MPTGFRNAGRRRGVRSHHVATALLFRHLLDGELTCKELAESSGLHYQTVLEVCAELHTQGVIFVSHWQKNGRHPMKVYKVGAGEKDARYKKVTGVEAKRNYESRKRQTASPLLQLGLAKPSFLEKFLEH